MLNFSYKKYVVLFYHMLKGHMWVYQINIAAVHVFEKYVT